MYFYFLFHKVFKFSIVIYIIYAIIYSNIGNKLKHKNLFTEKKILNIIFIQVINDQIYKQHKLFCNQY